LDGLYQRSGNEKTAYRYHGVFFRYQLFLGENPPSLTATQNFLGLLRKNGADPSTLRIHRAALAGFHQWRGEELKFKVKVPRKSAKYVPWEIVQRILGLATAKPHDELVLRLMTDAGLRRGEVTKLQVSNIEGSRLRFKGKGGNERTIPMTIELQKLVDHFSAGKPRHFTDSTSNVNYNEFAGNNVGIFVDGGEIHIEGNTISDGGGCGILFQAGEGEVYSNDIIGFNNPNVNGTGILFTADASGNVELNNIADNDVGIYSETDDLTINFNNITGNNVGLDNHTYENIDATKNWWGHASGPSGPNGRVNKKGKVIGKGDAIIGITDGNVEWDPYLPQPVGHTKHDPVPPGLLK
jgi:hypothetical protein